MAKTELTTTTTVCELTDDAVAGQLSTGHVAVRFRVGGASAAALVWSQTAEGTTVDLAFRGRSGVTTLGEGQGWTLGQALVAARTAVLAHFPGAVWAR